MRFAKQFPLYALSFLVFCPVFCQGAPGAKAKQSHARAVWPSNLPVYDHVVIVIEENKDYGQIINNAATPYISKTLVAEGANLTKMYGEEHYSEGNYFWLIAGGNFGVGFTDGIPNKSNNPNYPFMAPNLFEQLMKKGLSCKGYSESLPAIGDPVDKTGHYARKHVPWVSFGNIPNGKTADTSCNLRFADFPKDYSKLPTVSFVIPNQIHDMHDGPAAKSVPAGDAWLREHLDGYYQWAKSHNSLLILTFDEDANGGIGNLGLTDPAGSVKRQNRIPTVIAGAHVKHGDFAEGKGVTHVNLLRTLEAMYHLKRCGKQQANALKAGISGDFILTDVFEPVAKGGSPRANKAGKTR